MTLLRRILLGRTAGPEGVDARTMVLRDQLAQIIDVGFVLSPGFQRVLGTMCGSSTMLTAPDTRRTDTGVLKRTVHRMPQPGALADFRAVDAAHRHTERHRLRRHDVAGEQARR